MWNPPIVDEQLATRRSALAEAADLLAELVSEGARTIVFMKSRKAVELIARFAQLALEDLGRGELRRRGSRPTAPATPRSSGASSSARLVDGELLGVVSTDALELGIDIGSLDAAICVTFPGTVASLRQMWGRAGRRGRGLAVYVAGEDALDQFFCRHPDEFLDRPVEAAILDPFNEQIHAAHVLCAAHEGPLEPADAEFLGVELEPDRGAARGDGRAAAAARRDLGAARTAASTRRARCRCARRRATASRSSTSSRASCSAPSTPRARSTRRTRAPSTCTAAARSRSSSSTSSSRRALVQPFEGDWYTQAKRETDMYIERLLDRREWLGVTLSFGTVVVTEQVVAYQTRRLTDHEVLDLVGLDLPQTSFQTQALWYELPEAIVSRGLPLDQLLGALHAAEHSQIAVLPLLAMCDRWDIGGLSTNLHPQTGGPTIFIYDGHPGGIGITRRGFLAFDALVDDAHRLIGECPCEKGCPSCVQSPKCGNLNEPLSKLGAARADGADARLRAVLDDAVQRRVVAPARRPGLDADAAEPALRAVRPLRVALEHAGVGAAVAALERGPDRALLVGPPEGGDERGTGDPEALLAEPGRDGSLVEDIAPRDDITRQSCGLEMVRCAVAIRDVEHRAGESSGAGSARQGPFAHDRVHEWRPSDPLPTLPGDAPPVRSWCAR